MLNHVPPFTTDSGLGDGFTHFVLVALWIGDPGGARRVQPPYRNPQPAWFQQTKYCRSTAPSSADAEVAILGGFIRALLVYGRRYRRVHQDRVEIPWVAEFAGESKKVVTDHRIAETECTKSSSSAPISRRSQSLRNRFVAIRLIS
jgi:hypothetical protein